MIDTIKIFLTKRNLLITSACCIVIALPWSVWWNGFFLLLTIFFSLLHVTELKWRTTDFDSKLYILFLALYFFLHGLSILYTEHLREGLFLLEKKYVFALLPACLLIATCNGLTRTLVLTFFSYSVFIATLICLVLAANNNYEYNLEHSLPWYSFNLWFYSYRLLSYNIGMHPAYLSCFVSLVIFYLLGQIIVESKTRKATILKGVVVIYFLFNLIMLSSRNVLVTTLILVFFVGIIYVLYTRRIKLLLTGIVIYLLIFLTILSNDITRGRIIEIFDIGKIDSQWGNISLRLQEWDASLEIFRDNILFGAGPGDFTYLLIEQYESKGWTTLAQEKYNSHNQFIETLGSLGLMGFITLSVIFILSIKRALTNRDLLFAIFLASFLMFSLTESTLEVQKGIVFFTFFNSVFFFSKHELG